jgi:sugar phosphate isomerase/epimerase
MLIGYPNHPRRNFLNEINWIGDNHFDFMDVFLEEDKASPQNINVQKSKALLKKYSLKTVGHTSWYLPVGSPNKAIRLIAVKEISKCFKIFKKLEVKLVTIHANWASGLFSEAEAIDFQLESLKLLTDKARECGLELIYEPTVSKHDTIENIEKILKKVPNMHFHLDIGHANLNNNDPIKFIEVFHSKIKHVHLHDNDGIRDLHLPIGCGTVDWQRTINELKKYYDGTITLEIFSSDRDFVLLSKKKLRKLWDMH